MTKLVLLIGLPGSGKSSLAQRLLVRHPHWLLISTDTIRGKLFGDEAVQGPWLQVWAQVQQQFQQAVRAEKTAIYDATNTQRRHRREVIVSAREAGFKRILGVWLDTALELCLQRNQQRYRQVPPEIILQMHRQLLGAPPSCQEGLDHLIRRRSGYGNCDEAFSNNRT